MKDVENEIKGNAREKYHLDQYEEIYEGSDEDVLQKYKILHEQFSEVVTDKNNAVKMGNETVKQIKEIEEMFELLKKETIKFDLPTINNKEINNLNEMMICFNQLTDKIIDKEVCIFNRKEEEYEKQKEQRKLEFEIKKKEILDTKYQSPQQQNQTELNPQVSYSNTIKTQIEIPKVDICDYSWVHELDGSIKILQLWCGKQNFNIIFDSKIDGDGKGTLENKVLNKKNLYFISFTDDNNVFGGYVNESINVKGFNRNKKAFVFSLIRNRKVKNKKYNIKKSEIGSSFYLYSNCDSLYQFGGDGINSDIYVSKIGTNKSRCSPQRYDYNNEKNPLHDELFPFLQEELLF